MTPYDNYQRYLRAKKSVDDRALNARVWDRLRESLDVLTAATRTGGSRPRILELGSGIGTMIERLLDAQMMPPCTYVAVDELAANNEVAAAALQSRIDAKCLAVEICTETREGPDSGTGGDPGAMRIELVTGDSYEYLAKCAGGHQFDLVIAHAFLDLVDASLMLTQIRSVLKPGGLLFTSINFDGGTIFQPEIEPAFDTLVESCYHQTMDERVVNGKPSGDSHTGRHMFGLLKNTGFRILNAGSSDWVVFAGEDGYVSDEAYFLHFIVDTMWGALRDHPRLNGDRFARWIEQRHEQIESGELVYIAHQLDFLATIS